MTNASPVICLKVQIKSIINNFEVSLIKTLSLIMWLNRHFIMEPKSGPAPPRVVKVQIIGWIMSLTRKLQVLVVIVEHCWLFQQLYWIMLGCVLLGGSRLTWSSTDLSKAGIERKQFSNQSEEQLVHSAHSRSVYVILCHYSRLCDLVLVTLKYDARAGNGPDLWVLRGERPERERSEGTHYN